MPIMGKPIQKNPFVDVKMAPARNDGKKDLLRKLSGKEVSDKGLKFVDRKLHGKMGKNEFLKLLTQQLQNQDPMNPMDQRKFSADLAQFSQLEQLTNMNSKMEKMGSNKVAESKFFGASFLGKKVYTGGSTIKFEGGPTDIPVFLNNSAKEIRVRILDNGGNTISEFFKENVGKGQQMIEWDGKKLDSYSAAPGMYTFSVDAWDENLQKIEVDTKSSGIVKAVSFDNGEALLTLDDGKSVLLRDIARFEMPTVNNVGNVAQPPSVPVQQAKNNVIPQSYSDNSTGLEEY